MNKDNDTNTPAPAEYCGETLDELRMRRAMVAVRLDFQKEALQKEAQDVLGKHLQGKSLVGLFMGGNSGKHSMVNYIITGWKVMRMAYNFFRMFRRK